PKEGCVCATPVKILVRALDSVREKAPKWIGKLECRGDSGPNPGLRNGRKCRPPEWGVLMKKILLALVTAVFALGVMSHGAEAAKKKTQVVVPPVGWGWGWNGQTWVWTGPWTVRDPRLAASNFW